MLLEVCANSFQSAKNAEDAGAHRVELCQELSIGGITPSYGLLKQVINKLTIPVFVLIRPRSGDFVYTAEEFEIMKEDIRKCKELGVHGIVSGILNLDNAIDISRTKELIALSKPLPFTFHRAFDELDNPIKGLHELIHLGVSRILTSGQQPTAENGIQLLNELNKKAKGQITILPGSGINSSNAAVFSDNGFKEIHASASVNLEQKQGLFALPQTISSKQKIKDILNAL